MWEAAGFLRQEVEAGAAVREAVVRTELRLLRDLPVLPARVRPLVGPFLLLVVMAHLSASNFFPASGRFGRRQLDEVKILVFKKSGGKVF